MPSTARPRTARAEAAPDFGIVGMAPAAASAQQQQQQQRRPATATAARRSNTRASSSSSSSRRRPTARDTAAANAGGYHRSSSRSNSRPATSGRASAPRSSSGGPGAHMTAKELAAAGVQKTAAAAAAAASNAASTSADAAAEPESELVNWKIKNWQNHQKAIRRKQALASQGIELNHNQRPNNDILRVEAAERRAMAALERGFTERTLDDLRGIVQRRLFSFVKGGHFELGKTWKRIRQVGLV